jgi:hypothetical protein
MTWKELTVYPRVSRDDPSTWIDDTSNGSWKPSATGLDASLTQTAGSWYIRGLEHVLKAFRLFWGC